MSTEEIFQRKRRKELAGELSSSIITCFVTSDPAMPIAIPMSAFLSAGESLTPSPVTATMAPSRWNASTIFNFCCGEVRAKTISGCINSTLSSAESDMSFRVFPWMTATCNIVYNGMGSRP